jgi:PAS domain S-box-containing protein
MMDTPFSPSPRADAASGTFMSGGGASGALIRERDWSGTPLGPPADWPEALRTLVSVMLGSRQPMFIVWGDTRLLLYNDAYADILAAKHPAAMGRDLLDVWHEIRADLIEIVAQAYRGEPVQMDDIELWMERRGFREETHFAFSYTPVRDSGGAVCGFFCACQEITRQVVAERQLRESEARARTNAERVQLALAAGAIIGTWVWDVPADRFTVDDAFERTFGLAPGAGQTGLRLEQVIATVHPDDKAGLIEAIDAVMRSGGVYAHQYRVRRADGRYYWIEANGRIERSEDGRPLRFPGVLLDLEARRTAEAERDRATKLLRTFADAVPGVAYAKDRQGRMLVANRGTTELIGKPPEAYLGRTDAEFLDDKDQAAAVMANDARIMASGIAEQIEEPVSLPDGSEAIWLSTKVPLTDEHGEVIGLVGSSIDITARKRAEAALVASEERFRFALDAAGGIGTWDWDIVADRVRTSEQFARLYGIDPDAAAAGLPVEEYVNGIHPDDRAEVRRQIEEAVRTGGDYRAEYRIRGRDGDVRWVIARGRCLRDGEGRPVRFPGVTFDITDRIRAEEALREESRTLETLNRSGAAIAAELDLERLVQMVTDAGVELTGARYGAFFYNVEDEQGLGYMLYTLSGASRAAFEKLGMPRATGVFKPTFAGERVVRADDIRADPRYGQTAPHHGMPKGHLPVRSYLAVPVVSRSGEVIGALLFGHPEPGRFTARHEATMIAVAAQAAIAIDNARLYQAAQREIADRRRAEERLRDLAETLEQRVAEEIAARASAEDALRQAQKMEAVGQLTGGIAHDFNNLLTVVTGNIDMAARALDAAGLADARARRALANALKGTERAAALTQRLLAFARRQPLAPKPIDPDRLVAGMSDLLQRALGETIALEIVTSPGLWRVEVDPNQLESAILNLAVNARDAMPEGGTVTIETANAAIDDAYAADHAEVAPGHYVVIAVTDTGAGMSRETAARVFEPFFTTKEVGKGTGLGLSMVYGFTKQSGGHVKIYSEEGLGTTVKIYLPRLLSDAATEETPPRLPPEPSRGEETILVVEDDDDVRSYTVECLRELGYRVLEAHDGASALRLLERQEQDVDLLFTDVVMPGMTGRELADAAMAHHPGLKVLYTSGYTRNAIAHGGRLDEGVEMIGKPFTAATLARKVNDVLDKGQTGRVLLVEDEPTVRMLAAEALAAAGLAVDEAASAAEALARVRAARGRYDAVILDLPTADRSGAAAAAELRALHADLPILLASDAPAAPPAAAFAGDRCTGVIAKPYNAEALTRALTLLGVRCGARAP